eukprot:scaffold137843_cov31-Attheya_sp.AAC.2
MPRHRGGSVKNEGREYPRERDTHTHALHSQERESERPPQNSIVCRQDNQPSDSKNATSVRTTGTSHID